MTTYLNTSSKNYEKFVELSKKMAEDFLKGYNLYDKDSVRTESDAQARDELLINPTLESGVTAYVDFENSINLEELYKTVMMSIVESVTSALNSFDAEEEFKENWVFSAEKEEGLTAEQYEDKVYAAQEDFENASFLIDRDSSVLVNSYGFPKNEENNIWSLTHGYLDFFVKKSLLLGGKIYFTNHVASTLTGFQVEAVYSENTIVKYNVNINADEIAEKAKKEKISDVDILNFVINEVHAQIKAALNEFDAKEEYDTLANKGDASMKYYIKAEKYFKNVSELML